MHYVCIEDNIVTSILGYEPAVPPSVTVITITDDEHQQLIDQTHFFDISSQSVQPVDPSILAQKEAEQKNAIEREFLNSTDWKVLRHTRQKYLGQPTSLTEEEYLELERQRSAAAARIV